MQSDASIWFYVIFSYACKNATELFALAVVCLGEMKI
jgi:hypothetical protein